MSKKLKWLLGILAVLGLVAVGLLFFVVDQLPGPREIAHVVESSSNGAAASKATAPVPGAPIQTSTTLTSAPPAPAQAKPNDSKNRKDEVLVLMNEDASDIRVCDNLGAGPKSNQDMKDLKFEEMFREDSRSNPMLEALRIPLKAVFQDEQVSLLMNDVLKVDTDGMDRKEKDSFLKKLGFYGRATMTAAHLVGRKKDFETLADRAIHLSVIARIAAQKPELIDHPSIRGACEELERSIIQGDKVSLKKERQQILGLIKEAGLTPQELDFDPESYMKFDVKFTDNNLTFSLSDKEPAS